MCANVHLEFVCCTIIYTSFPCHEATCGSTITPLPSTRSSEEDMSQLSIGMKRDNNYTSKSGGTASPMINVYRELCNNGAYQHSTGWVG